MTSHFAETPPPPPLCAWLCHVLIDIPPWPHFPTRYSPFVAPFLSNDYAPLSLVPPVVAPVRCPLSIGAPGCPLCAPTPLPTACPRPPPPQEDFTSPHDVDCPVHGGLVTAQRICEGDLFSKAPPPFLLFMHGRTTAACTIHLTPLGRYPPGPTQICPKTTRCFRTFGLFLESLFL